MIQASIGFSIPITKMFTGGVIWRGIIYTLLMIIAKFFCGIWLVRLSFGLSLPKSLFNKQDTSTKVKTSKGPGSPAATTSTPDTEEIVPVEQPIQDDINADSTRAPKERSKPGSLNSPSPKKPISLYPSGILGSAMVARGEIGFLISSIAESQGIFTTTVNGVENSDIYLVVTWAIVLCTIIGPLTVGLLVRHVKKLQSSAIVERRDALGVWV